jgi:hypothetical protein
MTDAEAGRTRDCYGRQPTTVDRLLVEIQVNTTGFEVLDRPEQIDNCARCSI